MVPIITCVNYSDYLAITLPRTLQFFEQVVVLTDLHDKETERVAKENEVCMIATDVFYSNGSPFNKGAALDVALQFVRDDWLIVMDADIYLPAMDELPPFTLNKRCLYSPHRHMLESGPIPPEGDWASLPYGPEVRNGEFAGYYQQFHRSALKDDPPWYEHPMWRTAQGCDTEFWKQWGPRYARRLPFDVLHLGPTRINWSGRISPTWSNTDG